MLLSRGTELELVIESAAFEGKSVARVEGMVVFVAGGVPGDTVVARIGRVKKKYAEARAVRVVAPSPLRVTPRCVHFGVCGGCAWQHIDYAAQLRFKEQHVVDAFERIGGFSDLRISPILGADPVYEYRNKMEFSFSDMEWVVDPARVSDVPGVFLGLHVPQRYDKVLDIAECHLQSGLSNRILDFTRSFARSSGLDVYRTEQNEGYLRFLVVRQSKRTNESMVNLVTFDDRPAVMREYASALGKALPEVTTVVNTVNDKKAQVAFGETERVYRGEGIIHERLGPYTFVVSASSFFQTNTAQAERLYEAAVDAAGLKHDDTVYDLYAGTGSIALFISGKVRSVVGVESSASAIQDAGRNAAANGVQNCSFVLGDLKDRLTKDTGWMDDHPVPNAMIIDPPRSGMHPKVVDEILRVAPERIAYVSCNPATQARDIKLMAEKYVLGRLQPVDMFPHTYHIENVAELKLR